MTPKSVFQLSSHAFEFFLMQFLNYDFSVSNFAAGILFASMEHYRDQPMSFLCVDKDTGLDRIKSMSDEEVKEVGKLPSMANKTLKDRKHLEEMYREYFEEEEIVHIFLEAFQTSQARLIERPFGKRPRENYIRSLEKTLHETSEFRKYVTYLSLLDEDKFNLVVADFKSVFDARPDFRFTKYLEEVTCRLMADDLHEARVIIESQFLLGFCSFTLTPKIQLLKDLKKTRKMMTPRRRKMPMNFRSSYGARPVLDRNQRRSIKS